jgi:hypothetical protein
VTVDVERQECLRREWRFKRARRRVVPVARACPSCGVEFVPRRRDTKFCGATCGSGRVGLQRAGMTGGDGSVAATSCSSSAPFSAWRGGRGCWSAATAAGSGESSEDALASAAFVPAATKELQ